MLPPGIDAGEETDHSVERVPSALGRRAGVGRRSAVDDALADDAEARAAHAPAPLRRGMARKRERDVVEHPCAEQVDLPATVLFRRRADELDGHPDIVLGRRMQERADVRHGDKVVTTAVADSRKRVVLRDERDRRAGRTHAGPKCRLEATDTHLNLVPVALKQRRDPCCGATLLIGELRIGMDLAGELDQLVGKRRGDRLHDAVYCPIATFPLLASAGRERTSNAPPGPHRT